MAKESTTKGMKIGALAFTIGMILALVAGFIPEALGMGGIVIAVLVVLGIIVGFLNVTDQEVNKFLMASVSVMIAVFTAGSAIQSNITSLGVVGSVMWSILSSINVFVFPATIVVAIKAIYSLAKD